VGTVNSQMLGQKHCAGQVGVRGEDVTLNIDKKSMANNKNKKNKRFKFLHILMPTYEQDVCGGGVDS
jgi:hypothetical protein